ncbi:hypothetical protein HK100_001855 [Physocladia obscura]|uniref:Uncharacterized protein n=1 Tax=Physocladia obscura TaxID=109957 RepID=A0AAD5XGA5_9FUNG|nr:hypothetical protein HK100_001855 [Physocladia obscura]
MRALAALPSLRILSIASNQITRVDGIAELLALRLVDLCDNLIIGFEDGSIGEKKKKCRDSNDNICECFGDGNGLGDGDNEISEVFPTGLENLSLAGNPWCVCRTADYRLQLISAVPGLFVIDGVDIGGAERRLARMTFGSDMERAAGFNEVIGTQKKDTESDQEEAQESGHQSQEVLTQFLYPFKDTVDGILKRSTIRQAQTKLESRIRMDELIQEMHRSGKERANRVREITSSFSML